MKFKASRLALIEAIDKQSGEDVINEVIKSGVDINARDSNGVPALVVAIKKWDLCSFRKLLANGADANISDFRGNTPLSLCCSCRDSEFIKLLIKYGANVDGSKHPKSVPPLIQAVQSDSRIAKFLLRNRANPNVFNPTTGDSPLHLAICKKDLDLIEVLIRCGANVAAQSNIGRTPLHASIYPLESLEIAKTLVKNTLMNGLDINLVDSKGQTALHLACYSGSNAMISLLIDNGADINAKNIYSQTPAELALLYPTRRINADMEHLKKSFIGHMIALHSAGMYLRASNLDICNRFIREGKVRRAKKQSWTRYLNDCKQEVMDLKKDIIPTTAEKSWFDVLTSEDTAHLSYSVKEMDRTVINRFPIYGPMLKIKLYTDLAKARYESARKQIYRYLDWIAAKQGMILPQEIVIKIVSYLSNEDLRMFFREIRLSNDLSNDLL